MGRVVVNMAAPGRRAVWYAGFAVYAGGVALFSGPGLDHWWGRWAAGGYAAAAIVAVVARRRRWGAGLAVAVSLAGALAGPAWWLATREPVPPDVAVVARSGALLLHHGTPYLPLPALAGGWLAYNPYLPVMALFGVPGALGAPGQTWPWLIAATFLLLLGTVRVTSPDRPGRAALGLAAFWLACPLMAFPLTMGITDPPVIALVSLALALLARAGRRASGLPAGRGRERDLLAAALILAVACAMKYTAWPALVIIAVMVGVRDGAAAAAAGLVAALAPAALSDPAALARNTVAYPLGLTTAASPAQSPLPGHLLATLGPGGHLAALLLLGAAALAVVVSLVIAPPATPAAAAVRVAAGLSALFLLSPATRFGYFIYPLNLCLWALLAAGPRAAAGPFAGQAAGQAPALAADGTGARPGPKGDGAAACRELADAKAGAGAGAANRPDDPHLRPL